MTSPKKAPQIDWEKLDKLINTNKPGPEYFTTKAYASRYNISTDSAKCRLNRAVERNQIEVTKIKNINYYRIKV